MLLSSHHPLIPAIPRWTALLARRSTLLSFTCSLSSRSNSPPVLSSKRSDTPFLISHSASPPLVGAVAFRRGPELGLLSLLFVLSAVAVSFFAMAIIAFPTLTAFRRLKVSSERLSKVASEELSGTLSSLKLSGLEMNELTCQLNDLRQRLSGSQQRKKARNTKQTSRGGGSNPIIN